MCGSCAGPFGGEDDGLDVGAAEATLVEAGLLPDPVLGWDAMDAVAGVAIDGKVEDPAWLAGASLTWAERSAGL